jgi:hypothetical protein
LGGAVVALDFDLCDAVFLAGILRVEKRIKIQSNDIVGGFGLRSSIFFEAFTQFRVEGQGLVLEPKRGGRDFVVGSARGTYQA